MGKTFTRDDADDWEDDGFDVPFICVSEVIFMEIFGFWDELEVALIPELPLIPCIPFNPWVLLFPWFWVGVCDVVLPWVWDWFPLDPELLFPGFWELLLALFCPPPFEPPGMITPPGMTITVLLPFCWVVLSVLLIPWVPFP